MSDQQGIFTTVPTLKGTFACPNHGGGIEWNGGSYDAAVNFFFIPSTQECATWKIVYPTTVLCGPGFAHSSLSIAQLYGIVSMKMPLTAPGSLSKTDEQPSRHTF